MATSGCDLDLRRLTRGSSARDGGGVSGNDVIDGGPGFDEVQRDKGDPIKNVERLFDCAA